MAKKTHAERLEERKSVPAGAPPDIDRIPELVVALKSLSPGDGYAKVMAAFDVLLHEVKSIAVKVYEPILNRELLREVAELEAQNEREGNLRTLSPRQEKLSDEEKTDYQAWFEFRTKTCNCIVDKRRITQGRICYLP